MLGSLIFALLLGTPQVGEAPAPPACIGPTFVSWEACAAVAGEGTPAYSLAMINLGTQAYQQGDRAKALNYYDRAELPGRTFTGDVIFHTFRADARRAAGRTEEAKADARIAWGYLDGRPPQGTPDNALIPLDDRLKVIVLGLVLPITKDDEPAAYSSARAMFLGLPANDWMTLSLRASALTMTGDHTAAAISSAEALRLEPENPMSQNNHCYTLTRAGRAAEGLPFCEYAVARAPDVAAVRHSYATTLAAVGQCDAANVQNREARRLEPETELYKAPLTCTPTV